MYKWLTVVRGMGWQSQQQYVTAVHVMQFVLAAKDILVTGDIHLYQWTWTMKWCPEIQKEAIAIVSPSSFVHTLWVLQHPSNLHKAGFRALPLSPLAPIWAETLQLANEATASSFLASYHCSSVFETVFYQLLIQIIDVK